MPAALPRPTHEHQRLALKHASRAAIRLAGGGAAFALVTRIGETLLSDAQNPARGDVFLALDVALDADMEAGSPVITAALAEAQGYVLVRKDVASDSSLAPLSLENAAHLARHAGEAVSALIETLADGHLTEAERRRVSGELSDATAAFTAALNAVHGMVEVKKPAKTDRKGKRA